MHLRSAVRTAVIATACSLSVASLHAQPAPSAQRADREHAVTLDAAVWRSPLDAHVLTPDTTKPATRMEWQDQSDGDWSALRIAKWGTGVAAAGFAVYGVLSNRRADEQFEDLEQTCADDPARCIDRLPNGAYADAELEAQYQDVRSLDRQARASLIAGQVGIATSVVLFILDLRNSDDPDNIPYEPRRLEIVPARDGGMSLRMNVRLR